LPCRLPLYIACLHVSIYIHIHVHIQIYVYILDIHVYAYISICICMYVYIYMYIYVHIDMHIYKCICTYIHICVCTLPVYIYIHIHTHTYIYVCIHVYIHTRLYIYRYFEMTFQWGKECVHYLEEDAFTASMLYLRHIFAPQKCRCAVTRVRVTWCMYFQGEYVLFAVHLCATEMQVCHDSCVCAVTGRCVTCTYICALPRTQIYMLRCVFMYIQINIYCVFMYIQVNICVYSSK